MICQLTEGCKNYTEGTTDGCPSCNHAARKAAKAALKPKKKYVIPKQSEKMKQGMKQYSGKRKEHLKKYPNCQVKLIGCTGKAVEIHHVSSRGINLNNEDSFKSSCPECHRLLHDKLSAVERRKLGLLK